MSNTEEKAVAPKPESGVATYSDDLYENYSEAALEAEQDDIENESSFGPEDKLVTGRNVRRVLPPPKGMLWGPKDKKTKLPTPSPFKKIWQHRLEVPGTKRLLIFICPKRMAGRSCLSCEKGEKLEQTKNPVDAERASKLFPSRKFLCNWVNREKEHEGVRLGVIGIKAFEQAQDLREENGDYAHPVKGYDLIIKRKGVKRETTYKVLKGDSCLLHEDPVKGLKWIEEAYDLDLFADPPDENAMDDMEEQIIAAAGKPRSGGGGRSRDKDKDEETPKRRRASRSAQDDADDDDDDDDDD